MKTDRKGKATYTEKLNIYCLNGVCTARFLKEMLLLLNDYEVSVDTVNTPNKSVDQHRKQERLKVAISKRTLIEGKKNVPTKCFIKLAMKTS